MQATVTTIAAPEISLLAESCGRRPAETPAVEAPQVKRAPQSRVRAPERKLALRSAVRVTTATAGVLLMAFCIIKRDAMVRTAPSLAGAYAAIGLPVNLQGLQLRDIKSRFTVEASQRVLAVEGEIKNLRDHARSVPDIELSLRDDDGREIYRWSTPAPKANLDQSEAIQFRARLISPPEKGKTLRVHFAQNDPTPAER